ncbi:hypothetical protein [Billgrantia kenyensis]|uniref:Uncharacterized protein n=1 Tax=Billgrantia kenyensis TaxID=321266 RepID=A0A7V9W4R6_9GAMM|nr:hypothetical protein [Halomonas kenyensis]MBA2781053.1 hypothetical protein [Halomonas kenyensis]MCG6661504.1 hypothetical protein [Halomonas kenyensis]
MKLDETLFTVRNPLITHQRQLVTEYAFCLGEIPTMIRVRFYRQVDSERISSEQSHYIQTPLQHEPIYESADDHPSLESCLQDITTGMAKQYQQAEQAGYPPSESWLLPSRDFD